MMYLSQLKKNEFSSYYGKFEVAERPRCSILLGGLENPTHGCVYINDVDITQLSMEERSSFQKMAYWVYFSKF